MAILSTFQGHSTASPRAEPASEPDLGLDAGNAAGRTRAVAGDRSGWEIQGLRHKQKACLLVLYCSYYSHSSCKDKVILLV